MREPACSRRGPSWPTGVSVSRVATNLYATNREGVAIIERAILAHGAGSHLRILEAGCGNRWPVDLKGQSYELKGVDIDRNAVHIRQASARLSDSFQCGDLRNRGLFPAQTFDVIYKSAFQRPPAARFPATACLAFADAMAPWMPARSRGGTTRRPLGGGAPDYFRSLIKNLDFVQRRCRRPIYYHQGPVHGRTAGC